MVMTRRAAAERARAAAMAFSTLSGDEQGIILGHLRNALEPRRAHVRAAPSSWDLAIISGTPR